MRTIRQLIHQSGTVVFAFKGEDNHDILQDVLADDGAKCLGADPDWIHVVLTRDARRQMEETFDDLIEAVPAPYAEALAVTCDLPDDVERQIVEDIADALLETFRSEGYDAERTATRH